MSLLPQFPLLPHGDVSKEFLRIGLKSFPRAASYIRSLPYGRTSAPDPLLVLKERRGTCSTKNSLLAILAEENNSPVSLMQGFYFMNGVNTPGVAEVLLKYNLPNIPGAPCFLLWKDIRLDFSGDKFPLIFREKLLHEHSILPTEIGSKKTELHKEFLRKWLAETDGTFPKITLDDLWVAREECIVALSK